MTALVREVKPFIEGSRIGNVEQLDGHTLVMRFDKPDESRFLVVTLHPVLPALYTTDTPPQDAETTARFADQLRRHTIPGRVLQVRQRTFERVVHVDVETRDDAGQRAVRTVTVEMLGRAPQVILHDSATHTIIDAMRPATRRDGRTDQPGQRYIAPDETEPLDPMTASWDDVDRWMRLADPNLPLSRALVDAFRGVSPFGARQIAAHAQLNPREQLGILQPDQRRSVYNHLQRAAHVAAEGPVTPTVIFRHDEEATGGDTPTTSMPLDSDSATNIPGEIAAFWMMPVIAVPGETFTFPDMSHLLHFTYKHTLHREEMTRRSQALRRVCQRHLRRLQTKIKRQRREVAEGDKAETFRQYGDLLMASLHAVPSRSTEVTLPNLFEEGEPVTIALDPALSAVENATRYYTQYSKAKRAAVVTRQHLQTSLDEQRHLTTVLHGIDMALNGRDLDDIEEELIDSGYVKSRSFRQRRAGRTAEAGAAGQPLQFRSSDGLTILVGRNNRQNDRLTMRDARPHDFWLHVKDMPGAHVIVRSEGRTALPEKTLWEAANLAALYSQASTSSGVPVDVTQRRHVRKPKGSRPGMVLYENERTVFVTPTKDLGSCVPVHRP